MIRILARVVARLVRLAAWFALGWFTAQLVHAAIDRYRETDELVRTARRFYVGPDVPGRPSLGRAVAAADELAAHSPGPSPSIRLRIPEPD